MQSTREVIALLSDANPCVQVTEDRIRHALRRGDIQPPSTFAGRLAWTPEDILALAKALGLKAPQTAATQPEEVDA